MMKIRLYGAAIIFALIGLLFVVLSLQEPHFAILSSLAWNIVSLLLFLGYYKED